MTQNEIMEYCLSKPGAYVDYPFGPGSTIMKVKMRIFAQLFHLKGMPMATFNCDLMVGEFFRSVYPGVVTRGYHCPPVQQPYFNTVSLDGSVLDTILIEMINHSYERVVKKLPKAARHEMREEA